MIKLTDSLNVALSATGVCDDRHQRPRLGRSTRQAFFYIWYWRQARTCVNYRPSVSFPHVRQAIPESSPSGNTFWSRIAEQIDLRSRYRPIRFTSHVLLYWSVVLTGAVSDSGVFDRPRQPSPGDGCVSACLEWPFASPG